jgi:ATP phosphoribosyltransferase
MSDARTEIRIALPSKGRLAEETLDLLAGAGLKIYKPNPRQYKATIPALPGLTVLFQRTGDIVVSVGEGTVDFGITGWDIFSERSSENQDSLILLRELGIGYCTLNAIVPETWENVGSMADLAGQYAGAPEPLRVATKFPELTGSFFRQRGISNFQLITAEGTLEIAPTIGYADMIVDLISTGTTLRDNRLKVIEDGLILRSQGCLIANQKTLKSRPEVLVMARQLLEFLVAFRRGAENVAIFANIRGESPMAVAERMLTKPVIGGLQGPTISPVINHSGEDWHAVHIIVRKDQLAAAIAELRQIGGSGVIVAPVMYIFEEEPPAWQELLTALEA